MVTCNTYAPFLLTRELVVAMAKRNKETGKKSLVVFTSAMASISAIYNNSVYAGTKILNDYLAWGIEYEVSKVGIDVMAWRAGPVLTRFSSWYDSMF